MRSCALHKAAKFGDLSRVKELLESGETSQVNPGEYTPLHCAAMAIKPNAQIAKLLIDYASRNGKEWLNMQTNDSCNTALHIAAANVNVTEAFIQQFKDADTMSLNGDNQTPFHVAAKSYNQEVIIYMLNTFEPTNNRWDVDDVDRNQEFRNKLINACARRGNDKAVALLIKHGADISHGVLHEIVIESVKRPTKTKKLIDVYQMIVQNAVTWRDLEKDPIFLKFRSCREYRSRLRETMVWLLTEHSVNHDNKDVIQYALDYGATAMFWQFVNTKYVFRVDGKGRCELFDGSTGMSAENKNRAKTQNNGDRRQEDRYWTVFDVTCFTKHTLHEPEFDESNSGRNERGGPMTEVRESIPLCLHNADQSGPSNDVTQQGVHQEAHNFKNPDRVSEPYLSYLLLAFNHWRNSDILNMQPFKKLVEPYVKLLRTFYIIFLLMQLIFITSFTAIHIPSRCSLAQMFNVPTMRCTNYSNNDTDIAAASNIGRQRSWFALLWLIWPAILIPAKVFTLVQRIKQAKTTFERQSDKAFVAAKDMKPPTYEYIDAYLHSAFSIIFSCAVVLWLFAYFISDTYELYVACTVVVLLFGWIANLEFVVVVRRNFNIFALVLGKIVLKDIPHFLLFFGFIVVGYSVAVHSLLVSSCSTNDHWDTTFFSVLSSAFGIGDFYEASMSDSTCAGASSKYLFEIMYFFYVCATMIILLNVLIAMMNIRYERGKKKAKNIMKFQLLSLMRALEKYDGLENVLKTLGLLKLPDVRDRPDDVPRHGSLYFNRKNKRYYLQLVLPVDEERQRLHQQ